MIFACNKKVKHEKIDLILGKQYTLTFKYSNQEGNNYNFKIKNGKEIELVNTVSEVLLQEVVYTFIATEEVTYEITCTYADNTKGGFYTDLIIKSGDIRSDWEPANGEFMGSILSLYYNGIKINSINSSIQTIINNLGFTVTDMNDLNNIIIALNNLRVLLGNTEINGYLKIKTTKIEEQIVENNNLLFIG